MVLADNTENYISDAVRMFMTAWARTNPTQLFSVRPIFLSMVMVNLRSMETITMEFPAKTG